MLEFNIVEAPIRRLFGIVGLDMRNPKLGRSVRWRSTQLASFGRLEQPTEAGTP